MGQIALTAVLFSMIAGASLIRFNQAIVARLARALEARGDADERIADRLPDAPEPQVIVGGYA